VQGGAHGKFVPFKDIIFRTPLVVDEVSIAVVAAALTGFWPRHPIEMCSSIAVTTNSTEVDCVTKVVPIQVKLFVNI